MSGHYEEFGDTSSSGMWRDPGEDNEEHPDTVTMDPLYYRHYMAMGSHCVASYNYSYS